MFVSLFLDFFSYSISSREWIALFHVALAVVAAITDIIFNFKLSKNALYLYCFALFALQSPAHTKQFISVRWVHSKQNSPFKYFATCNCGFRWVTNKKWKFRKLEIAFSSRHSVDCCIFIIWMSVCTDWTRFYSNVPLPTTTKYVRCIFISLYAYAQSWNVPFFSFHFHFQREKNGMKWNNKMVTYFSTTVPKSWILQ